MHQYVLRGVDVQFPYEAYPCQLAYMERVIQALQQKDNALLESPTGTGKTLCLLCAALAWRESFGKVAQPTSAQAEAGDQQGSWSDKMKAGYAELRAEGTIGAPTIVYSSRTHSQLAQVMKELRNTSYRPRCTVLGSRKQMCLHPTVSTLAGAAANQACRSLMQTRSCKWGNEVDSFISSHADVNAEPLDIEDLVKLGQMSGPCPYLLSKEMAASADIVFMPYNYLIDAKTRLGLGGITWQGAVLIFDEAHNLEGVCSDSASFDLPAAVLASCVQEVQAALEIALVWREDHTGMIGRGDIAAIGVDIPGKINYFEMANNLRTLKEVLLKLESLIAALPIGQDGYTAPGAFMFDLLAKVNLKEETFGFMLQLLEQAMDLLSDNALAAGRKSGSRNTSHRLHAFADCLRLVFNSNEAAAPGLPPAHLGYKVHVHMEKSKAGMSHPTLSYWCFSPGISMRQLAAMHVRSVLLTSGTLSPLDSFAHELQLPFKISLENPHVINPSQVWVGVVPTGPKGTPLNSSYQHRDSREYKEDLGYAVINFARMVPDGLLVFFPSYGVLKSCTDFWKNTSVAGTGGSIWERIMKHKLPVVEPRESADFPMAAQDFRDKLNDPSASGAVFLAVCRGKVSEGLDFSDRAGRAVLITGIPYAMKTDPKVRLKKEILDENARGNSKQRSVLPGGLTGDQWYVQQASRAVNQAMGRVIRHRQDYGAIIMCDERFQTPGSHRQLSSWLRGLVQVYPNFGAVSGSLTKFFRDQASVPSNKEVEAVRPSKKADFGSGSGILGALNSNAFTHKPGTSNMQRLGTKMAIPSAIDTSGLVHYAPPKAATTKAASAGRSFDLLSALESRVDAEHQHRSKRAHVTLENAPDITWPAAEAATAVLPSLAGSTVQRPRNPRPDLPKSFGRSSGQPAALGSGSMAAGPSMVGPAHLLAKLKQAANTDDEAQAQVHVEPAPAQRAQMPRRTPLPAPQPSKLTYPPPAPALTATAALASTAAASAPPTANAAAASVPAGSTAAAAKMSSQDKRQQTAKAYLAKLQEALPTAAYQQLMKCLQQYRKNHDTLQVTDGVLEVLRPPERRHLLLDFATFLRAQDRDWFLRCIKQISQDPSSEVVREILHPPAGAAKAQTQNHAQSQAGQQSTAKPHDVQLRKPGKPLSASLITNR